MNESWTAGGRAGKTHDLTQVFQFKEPSRKLILKPAEIAERWGEGLRRGERGSGGGGGKGEGRDRSRRPGQGNEEKEEDGERTVNVAH